MNVLFNENTASLIHKMHIGEGEMKRIAFEKKTVKAMIGLFCRDHHGKKSSLCLECGDLLEYSLSRLAHCKFGEKKPTCAKCIMHCYKPECREKIRSVMRHSGPRMLLKHPVLAMRHIYLSIRRSRIS